MLKLAAFLFCSFIALDLSGSMADAQDKSLPACALTDAPNQCGAFCLAALRPIIDNNRKTEEKLLTVDNAQKDMRNHLEKIETEIFNLPAMDKLQSLENVQKEILSQLQRMEAEIKSQKQSSQNSLEKLFHESQAQAVSPPISKFEKIGQKNFYIERNIAVEFFSAKDACKKMGGFLVKYNELEAFKERLPSNHKFWLDMCDFQTNRSMCYTVKNGKYSTVPWYIKAYFICQLIEEA